MNNNQCDVCKCYDDNSITTLDNDEYELCNECYKRFAIQFNELGIITNDDERHRLAIEFIKLNSSN